MSWIRLHEHYDTFFISKKKMGIKRKKMGKNKIKNKNEDSWGKRQFPSSVLKKSLNLLSLSLFHTQHDVMSQFYYVQSCHYLNIKLLSYHWIEGTWWFTTHVNDIVLPTFTWISLDPTILANFTENDTINLYSGHGNGTKKVNEKEENN